MPKTQVLINMMKRMKGFDEVIKNIKIISANDGNCKASLIVAPEHANPMGGLHGGFSATLVDSVSSWGLLTHPHGEKPSVSVNINMTYLKGALVGDEIFIETKTLRCGKTLAFLNVEIRNKDNELLVKGEHTKYMMPGMKFL